MTSEKKEIKKGDKKKNVGTWKSACNHCDMEFLHKKTSALKMHLNSKHPPVGKIVDLEALVLFKEAANVQPDDIVTSTSGRHSTFWRDSTRPRQLTGFSF